MGVIGKADDQADCSHAYTVWPCTFLCEDWKYLLRHSPSVTDLLHQTAVFLFFIL